MCIRDSPTIARQAIAAQLLTETLSEEMRLLYAMCIRDRLRTYTTARYYTEDEIITMITKGAN